MWKLPVLFLVVCALGQQSFPGGTKGGVRPVVQPPSANATGEQEQGGMQGQGQERMQGPDWRGVKLGKGKGKGKEADWMLDPKLMIHKLFFDHSWFKHAYFVASIFELETAEVLKTRLDKNQEDIGTDLAKFFPNVGQQSSQITKLFTDHIAAADLLLKDKIEKNKMKGEVKSEDIGGEQEGQVTQVTQVERKVTTEQGSDVSMQAGQEQTPQPVEPPIEPIQPEVQAAGKGKLGKGQVVKGGVSAGKGQEQMAGKGASSELGLADEKITALYSQGDKLADGLVQFLSLEQNKLKDEWHKHNEYVIKLIDLLIDKKFSEYIQHLDLFTEQLQLIAEIIALKVPAGSQSQNFGTSQTTSQTTQTYPLPPVPVSSPPNTR